MQVTYIGPHAEGVQIADVPGDPVKPGESIEVDAEVAGHPPKGTPGEDGYDPGAGLLAQVDNWAKPTTRAAKAAADKENA